MKSISASLVLLSGAILLAVGSLISHDQTQLALQFTGAAIGAIGLAAWFKTMSQPNE